MSELPQGWAVARIGEICEASQYGFTAKAQSSGDVHFLRTTDITSGDVDWATVPYCNIQKTDKEKYLLKDGDVVISRAGSVGYSYLLRNPKPSVFASYLIRFRPLISAEYFSYFLKTPAYWEAISEQSLGIAVQNVNATKLAEIEIPIAPASEQARIVEKLEELLSDLDAGVAELKAAQRKLAQYRQSLLKAAVDGTLTADWRAAHGAPQETGAELLQRILTERRARWEQKQLAKYAKQGKTPPKGWQAKYPEPVAPDLTDLPPLPQGWTWASVEQLAELTSGHTPKDAGQFAQDDGVVHWFKVGDMNTPGNEDVLTAASARFTKEAASELGLKLAPAGTIVFPKRGGAIATNKKRRLGVLAAYDLNMMGLVPAPSAAEWLWSWFKGVDLAKLSDGSNIPQINNPDIAPLHLPIPPAVELEVLIGRLEKSLESTAQQEEAVAKALKQAAAQRKNVLKSAFTGRLVPQDPNDEPASALLARIRAKHCEEVRERPSTSRARKAR